MSVSAMDLVGLTMKAKKRIPLYKIPGFDKEPMAYVEPGNIVGVVDTWLDPAPTRGLPNLWWGYRDDYGRLYYSEHKDGVYDWAFLRQQGLKTTEEIIKEQADKDKPWYERAVDKAVPLILTTVLIAAIGGAVVKGLLSRKSE